MLPCTPAHKEATFATYSINVGIKMHKRVLVAGYADWNVESAALSVSEIGFSVTTLGVREKKGNDEDALIGYEKVALPLLSKVVNRLFSGERPMFMNPYILRLYENFDKAVSNRILEMKPDFTILCTTMAEQSINASRDVGAKSVLLVGGSPLEFFEKYLQEIKTDCGHVDKRWKEKQGREFKTCDRIVVESSFVKADCEKLGVPRDKIKVVPPHVRQTRGKGPAVRPIIFGTVQIGFGKGTHRILEWWGAESFGYLPLVLLGNVNKFWQKKISETQAKVEAPGYLQSDFYHKEMKRISVSLFPTYSDGGPRSLFESMAYGQCPIVSDRCAGKDHINNGETGFVIPLNEDERWRETISWCVEHPQRVKEMGAKARQYVESKLMMSHLPEKWREALLFE